MSWQRHRIDIAAKRSKLLQDHSTLLGSKDMLAERYYAHPLLVLPTLHQCACRLSALASYVNCTEHYLTPKSTSLTVYHAVGRHETPVR
jgi:hypothetical protein